MSTDIFLSIRILAYSYATKDTDALLDCSLAQIPICCSNSFPHNFKAIVAFTKNRADIKRFHVKLAPLVSLDAVETRWLESSTPSQNLEMERPLFLETSLQECKINRIFREICPLKSIAEPLESLRDVSMIGNTVKDAFEAHKRVFELTKTIHRDISVHNIVSTADPLPATGFLIDWDLKKDESDNYVTPEKFIRSLERPGSYRFLSVRSKIRISNDEYGVRDVLESFYHVLNWMALNYITIRLHKSAKRALLKAYSVGGSRLQEKHMMIGHRDVEEMELEIENPAFADLLFQIAEVFATYYRSFGLRRVEFIKQGPEVSHDDFALLFDKWAGAIAKEVVVEYERTKSCAPDGSSDY